MAQERCPRCGMTKDQWKGNGGKGMEKDGQTYCCVRCAYDTGCTCVGSA